MKKGIIFFFAASFLLSASGSSVDAQSIAASVSGRILLDVEQHGEAWYVYPPTLERYYLRDGDAAYEALRTFGLGITDDDIAKIPIGIETRFEMVDTDSDTLPDAVEVSLGTDQENIDTDGDGNSDATEVLNDYNPLGFGTIVIDHALADRLKGRILLQVETHGEAWYVNPVDAKRYYLGNGEAAYQIMRYLSLGITSSNLAEIDISADSPRPPFDDVSQYDAYTIATDEGAFAVKVVMLRRDVFEMVTDTGDSSDCTDDCTAKSLGTYIAENEAFAGIHGTYFCPPDYTDCSDKTYVYYPPVFNSALDKMINDDAIVFHNRPMIVQTTDGQIHYFHRPDDFGDTLSAYEAASGLIVNAAIGNWPSLVEGGVSVVSDEPLELAFYSLGTRGGLGWDDTYFYLVIASNATVQNLAEIFETLGVDNAMNLDGGGSAALYYDGAYKVGPGRLLPNAVLFKEK